MAENKTIYKFCKKHGETEYVLYKDGKFRCKKCAVEAVQRRRQKIKETLVKYKGGKCEICGYSKCLSALDFHHINPNEKEFSIGAKGYTRNIKECKNEADKCILVCANCHREIHAGLIDITQYSHNISSINDDNLFQKGKKQTICPVCGESFDSVKGKKFCSPKCREKYEGRDKYPSKTEVISKYDELHSWEKVAKFYNLTRRIIQRIRQKGD